MAAGLIEKLPEAILYINNCDISQYADIDCLQITPDIHGHPAQCSNDVFCLIIKYAPLGEDLLIIEDDVELCKDFEQELYSRAEAIEAKGIDKYTINPLYTPARMTRYTQHQDFRTSYSKYQFINQNWVDTNLFIPAALLPEFKEWYTVQPPIRSRANGIGKHHSVKMYEAGYPMLTCIPSLLGHGDHESIIYPEARKKVPLIAKI